MQQQTGPDFGITNIGRRCVSARVCHAVVLPAATLTLSSRVQLPCARTHKLAWGALAPLAACVRLELRREPRAPERLPGGSRGQVPPSTSTILTSRALCVPCSGVSLAAAPPDGQPVRVSHRIADSAAARSPSVASCRLVVPELPCRSRPVSRASSSRWTARVSRT